MISCDLNHQGLHRYSMTRGVYEAPEDEVPDDEGEIEGDGGDDNPFRVKRGDDTLAHHPGHQFTNIRGTGKTQSNIPSVVGDGPVNVRGPDERQMTGDTQYVVALFNYRDQTRAQESRNKLLSGELGITATNVRGPMKVVTKPEKQPDGKVEGGITYYSNSVSIDVPEGQTPNEFIRSLKSRKAAEVQGPFKRAGKKSFELTVQKRSGATETLFFDSKEKAEAAKAEIEKGIRDNPVQGIVARRVATGQSALSQRGLTQRGYFSDKASKAREHAALLKSNPDSALGEIARDLGLEIALDPNSDDEARLSREILVQKVGKEKAAHQISNAKEQLDAYIKRIKTSAGASALSHADIEKLKPKFDGSFKGQTHTVKGRAQLNRHQYIDPKTGELKKGGRWREGRSSYEFVWDGSEWLTPVEYSAKRRGTPLPSQATKDKADPEVRPTGAAKDPKDRGKRSAALNVVSDTSSKKYLDMYIDTLEKVGKHYLQSKLTMPMAEAIRAVARTARAKGSPTKKSLENLASAVQALRAEIETRGEGFTPRAKENAEYALHAGYICLSQKPPTYEDFSEPEEDVPDRGGFAAAAARSAGLGLKKADNTPKSIGREFDKAAANSTGPRRKHVAVAPGLPAKVVDTVPREYLRSSEDGWQELDYMLRGEDDSTFAEPKDSTAWNALRANLSGDRPEGDIEDPDGKTIPVDKSHSRPSQARRLAPDLKRSHSYHPGPARKSASKPAGGADSDKRDAETPWRQLARLHGKLPDAERDDDDEVDD